MITLEKLPSEYEPYQELDFCSNKILGGGHIIALGQILPLLVGRGKTPRVWLQAVASPSNKEFVLVVSDSASSHPAVEVSIMRNQVAVTVRGKLVLSVESIDDLRATVTEVDLRPLGLNVFGNSDGLSLGGMRLSHNTMSGVGVAFGLGT